MTSSFHGSYTKSTRTWTHARACVVSGARTHVQTAHTKVARRQVFFYSLASLVSIIALVLKVRMLLQQLRERRNQFALEEGLDGRALKLQKHRQPLVKTSRKIHMTYSSLMVGCVEGLPLGVLQGANVVTQSLWPLS